MTQVKIPEGTLRRLYLGNATGEDQMIAYDRLANNEADRQQSRGEPVAFFYLLATGFDANQMYSGWSPRLSFNMPNVPDGGIRNLKPLYAAQQPSEPAKGPTDDDIEKLANQCGFHHVPGVQKFARAVLAQYGQPVEPGNGCECNQGQSCQVCDPIDPEGWQPVPNVPTHEMIRALREDAERWRYVLKNPWRAIDKLKMNCHTSPARWADEANAAIDAVMEQQT